MTEIELAENVPATERALHLELNAPRAPRGLAALAALPSVTGVSASFAGPGPGRQGIGPADADRGRDAVRQ